MLNIRPLMSLVVLLALAGCGSEEALVRVSFLAREPLSVSMLRVEISDGNRIHRLTGSDFRARGGVIYDGPELATRRSGTLRVSYALVTSTDDTVSAGDVTLPLRSDWRYGIEINPSTTDPTLQCFGCLGARAFPLASTWQGAGFDSVFVVWGGNSIQNPVVY